MTSHQVLEFTLGEEQYCIDIEYVTEVVSRSKKDVTSIPDSPPHVEGAIDLRGETTRVIDPSADSCKTDTKTTGSARTG